MNSPTTPASIIAACPVCRSSRYRYLFDVRDHRLPPQRAIGGRIRRCDPCGMLYKEFWTPPEDSYGERFAESFLQNEDYSAGPATTCFFRRVLADTLSRLAVERPRLLDVGCGIGTLLGVAAELGCQPAGVEISRDLAAEAARRGYQVFCGDIADLRTDQQYDIITLMDLIEHLVDPARVLRQIHRWLKPGGELVVYTPNHASLVVDVARWMYRLGWRRPVENIFACNHTCFFTPHSLEGLLRDTEFVITARKFFPYDVDRPGQRISRFEKLAIRCIESLGRVSRSPGFRMIFSATGADSTAAAAAPNANAVARPGGGDSSPDSSTPPDSSWTES